MRLPRLLLIGLGLALAAAAGAQSFAVPPLARVVDQAGLLAPATREQLSRLIAEHERRTSNQVVVVTLRDLAGHDIAEIGLLLGRGWQLGTRQYSNGALLIVAPKERRVRIEVGYGLEGALPDARAFQIIDREIVPRFRAGDIEGGIVKGTLAIIASIEGTYQAPPPPSAPGAVPILFVVGLAIIVIVAIARSGGGAGPGGFGAGRRRGVWGTGPLVFGPGRGGVGGGGFGGGGGSFGGGGATGRW